MFRLFKRGNGISPERREARSLDGRCSRPVEPQPLAGLAPGDGAPAFQKPDPHRWTALTGRESFLRFSQTNFPATFTFWLWFCLLGRRNQLPPTRARYFSYSDCAAKVLSATLPDSRNYREFGLALDMIKLVKVS